MSSISDNLFWALNASGDQFITIGQKIFLACQGKRPPLPTQIADKAKDLAADVTVRGGLQKRTGCLGQKGCIWV